MAEPSPPHFDLPFRFDTRTGHAAVVEQDTVDDIAVCVEAVLRTRPGQRAEHPQFGTPDLAFMQQPLDLEQLAQRITAWEPRARVLIDDDDFDQFDALLARLRINVATEG